MRNSVRFTLGKRWPAVLLAGAAGAGMTVGGLRLQALLQQQLPVILKSRLEAALGRPVRFGALHVTPAGMWVDELRVERAPHEIDDPLTAHHLRVSLDWWGLLTARRIRVHGVDLDGARLVVSPGSTGAAPEPWTAQVLSLSRSGISHFGLRDTAIRMAGRPGRPDVWFASGINGDLALTNTDFHYRGRAASWTGASITLAGLHVDGSGTRDALQLKDGGAVYQGGRFEASGRVGVTQSATDLAVRVKDMALARLAPQLGIPADWAMKGSVTGELWVDAQQGALRAVRGKLHVDRGSLERDGGRFPWKEASANLDWSPSGARFSDVEVRGPGLDLTGGGTVRTPGGKPFTEGRFHVDGRVRAETPAAVAQVGELLAFRRMLNGRWQARDAQIRFAADGRVGNLREATADGRIQVRDLQFQPQAGGETVHVSHLEGDARRSAHRLTLSNIQARTDGLTLNGGLTLTDDQPGHPGEYRASGAAVVKDLKSLRRAIPEAALWKWVPTMSPTSSGTLEFKLGAPTADPSRLWAEGTFDARDFRLGGHSALPNGSMFFVPIQEARGAFRHTAGALTVSNLELRSPTFHAAGDLRLGYGANPTVASRLHLVTEDWRSIPAMPPTALEELHGGHFEADFGFESPLARLSQVPLSGSFVLRDAEYTPRRGARPVPVRSVGARFRWADGSLDLPSVTLDTPVLQASARGGMSAGKVALDVEARTADAGALAASYLDRPALEGGAGTAQFHLEGALNRLNAAALTGTVHLADARLLQAFPGLGLPQVDARELTAQFARRADGWDLSDLSLRGPQGTAALRGGLRGTRLEGDVRLQLARWTAPASLPLTGGTVALEGKLQGDVADAKSLAFTGNVRLEGAQPRYDGAGFQLHGGRLVVTAQGEGPLADAAHWLRGGTVELTGADLTTGDSRTRKVELASAAVTRDGDRYRVAQANFRAAGLTGTASGSWSATAHELRVAADLADPRALGVKLPEGASLKQAHLEGTLEGTAEVPVRSAQGTLQVNGAQLALAGAAPLDVRNLLAAFHYSGNGFTVDRLEGQGAGGTLTARGTWGTAGQDFQVTADGKDLGRLGIRLPEGIVVGGYHLAARLSGTSEHPLSTRSGVAELRDARFSFGPGGAHRLDLASVHFSSDANQVRITDLSARGPEGALTGTGDVSGGRFHLALQSAALSPSFAAWLLPGTVRGGQLSGTLTLSGTAGTGLESAAGHFDLANAEYLAPRETGFTGGALQVARFAGDYRWAGADATIQKLLLRSDRLNGDGTLTLSASGGKLSAALASEDLGRAADLVPEVRGMVRGGHGTAGVNLAWGPDGARGAVRLTGGGGVLTLPNIPAEFAQQPVDSARLDLRVEPGKLAVSQARIRGPKGNLDGSGEWTAGNGVSGSGKAWFSKGYTSHLLPKGVGGMMARLMGVRQLTSDWTLTGTPDRLTLNAGITRNWIWKYARNRVPKEFQAVAAGKSPLWERGPASAESVVAAAVGEPSGEAGQ